MLMLLYTETKHKGVGRKVSQTGIQLWDWTSSIMHYDDSVAKNISRFLVDNQEHKEQRE